MNPDMQKRLSFTAKSIVWSLLLFAAAMVATNWEDITGKANGKQVTVVNSVRGGSGPEHTMAEAPSISTKTGMVNTIVTIFKTLAGFTAN